MCLPQNSINTAALNAEDPCHVLYRFVYGSADNAMNNENGVAIDLRWAIYAEGKSINLSGIDFIKIYNGVNQESGLIGECFTDIMNIKDLHVLDIDINSED